MGSQNRTVLTCIGHDPKGALLPRLEETISFLRDTFGEGLTFVLSEPTLDRYPREISKWNEVVETKPNQALQFQTAVQTALQRDIGSHVIVMDYDRVLHAAKNYPSKKNYPSQLERMAEEVQGGDFTFCCRSETAFETHPMSMRNAEQLSNMVASPLVEGKRLDYWSGAYGVSNKLLSKFPLNILAQGDLRYSDPVYPVFVATSVLISKIWGMKLQYEDYDCLSYETEYEARDEIEDHGGPSVWVQFTRLTPKEIGKRVQMANDWIRVFEERVSNSATSREWGSREFVICSDGRHIISDRSPKGFCCYDSLESYDAKKVAWEFHMRRLGFSYEPYSIRRIYEKDGQVNIILSRQKNMWPDHEIDIDLVSGSIFKEPCFIKSRNYKTVDTYKKENRWIIVSQDANLCYMEPY